MSLGTTVCLLRLLGAGWLPPPRAGWLGVLGPLRWRAEKRVLSAEARMALFGRAGTITNDI